MTFWQAVGMRSESGLADVAVFLGLDGRAQSYQPIAVWHRLKAVCMVSETSARKQHHQMHLDFEVWLCGRARL